MMRSTCSVSRRMWEDVFVVIGNKCSSPSVSVANVVLCIKDVLMSFFLFLAAIILRVPGSMVLQMWVICSHKTCIFNFLR
jgi:hypothetical protein